MLVAIYLVAVSYITEPPNNVEPTHAAVALDPLLGASPKTTNSPILESRGLGGRGGFGNNTCAWNSQGM